jgi:hypothetical protein
MRLSNLRELRVRRGVTSDSGQAKVVVLRRNNRARP